MVKSISYDQSEIIKWILDLHVENHKIDCDPTYDKKYMNAIDEENGCLRWRLDEIELID